MSPQRSHLETQNIVDRRLRTVNNVKSLMNRRLFIIALLLGLLSAARAEPKAYDLVNYKGKAAGVTIVFGFADGYPEASTLKTIDAAGGKTTKFTLDQMDKTMKFVPEKGGGAIKSVSLDIDGNDRAPAKVAGSCLAGGKSVPFTLLKSK